VLFLISSAALDAEPAAQVIEAGSRFTATDTLDCADEQDPDARACLDTLAWPCEHFHVRLAPAEAGCGDFLVKFPSARILGDPRVDKVSMEWFAAKDASKVIATAPAVVVIHESGRRMTVGRLVARSLGARGIHAFLLHLPGYGTRRVTGFPKLDQVIPAIHQAVADTRRARDAVAAIPAVDSSAIGLQGTSLGGFVAAAAAGLDDGYNRVFIVLAGGDLNALLASGAPEIAKTRAKLAAAGVTDAQIQEAAAQLEPLRLAHRINAKQTWLYTGRFDTVVPPHCSLALARAASLPADHHIELPASHYTAVLYLPKLIEEISANMRK
jgi:dienelactone hydrolase